MQVLYQPTIKIFCESCNKEVTHHSHIKFSTKQLCPPCFAQLQSFPSTYIVQQKLNFPIFQPTWSAYQQVLLLKSIEKWGFGNWRQIRDFMQYFGAKFTEEQIESHYNEFFLHEKTYKLVYFYDYDGVSDELLYAPTKMIPGYNNLRRQFNFDFDENAQKSLVNLQFKDDDLPEERQVKFKMIEDYNQRLKKRYEVQDFIIKHKLLDKDIQKAQQEGRSVYEKQAAEQLKRVMKFNSFDEHNELVRRVALEKQLKQIIEGLRSFRKPSNSGKLKEIFERLKKRSTSPPKQKQIGKPRKMVHGVKINLD